MDQEIENVKKEYEAKLKRQKEQKEEKAKKEEKGKKEKDEKKEEEQQVADAIELSKIEKERDEKVTLLVAVEGSAYLSLLLIADKRSFQARGKS